MQLEDDESSSLKLEDRGSSVILGSGSRWRGLGVKVLGEAAAGQLQPLSVRRLMGYMLMDMKRTYLMTGMLEEALGIIRSVGSNVILRYLGQNYCPTAGPIVGLPAWGSACVHVWGWGWRPGVCGTETGYAFRFFLGSRPDWEVE